jgi:hypothetical protein
MTRSNPTWSFAGYEPVEILEIPAASPARTSATPENAAGMPPPAPTPAPGSGRTPPTPSPATPPPRRDRERERTPQCRAAHSDLEPCPWCVGDDDDAVPLRALGAVLGDLADLGYDAIWHGLRAADVGAPHGRFRVFVVAWPAGGRRLRENGDPYGERTNPTLVDAVMLLPTPVTSDVKAVRNATAVRADPASAHSGTTLTDLFVPRSDGTPVLLPTPTTSQGGPEATRVRPDGSKGQTNLAGALLPTPLARDHRTGYQQERTERVGSPPLNDAVVTIARPPVKPSGDRTEEPSDDGKLF